MAAQVRLVASGLQAAVQLYATQVQGPVEKAGACFCCQEAAHVSWQRALERGMLTLGLVQAMPRARPCWGWKRGPGRPEAWLAGAAAAHGSWARQQGHCWQHHPQIPMEGSRLKPEAAVGWQVGALLEKSAEGPCLQRAGQGRWVERRGQA